MGKLEKEIINKKIKEEEEISVKIKEEEENDEKIIGEEEIDERIKEEEEIDEEERKRKEEEEKKRKEEKEKRRQKNIEGWIKWRDAIYEKGKDGLKGVSICTTKGKKICPSIYVNFNKKEVKRIIKLMRNERITVGKSFKFGINNKTYNFIPLRCSNKSCYSISTGYRSCGLIIEIVGDNLILFGYFERVQSLRTPKHFYIRMGKVADRLRKYYKTHLWSKKNHKTYLKSFREQIEHLMLISNDQRFLLYKIPNDVLFYELFPLFSAFFFKIQD